MERQMLDSKQFEAEKTQGLTTYLKAHPDSKVNIIYKYTNSPVITLQILEAFAGLNIHFPSKKTLENYRAVATIDEALRYLRDEREIEKRVAQLARRYRRSKKIILEINRLKRW
jgi:hypothetical protein